MAMCSYQTLARYDDCSRRSRARHLDDVRSQQRQDLYLVRALFRNLKMIQNRRSLLGQFVPNEEDESDYSPYSPGYDEPDCLAYQGGSQITSPESISCSNQLFDGFDIDQSEESQSSQTPWLSPAPSPAWSSSTTGANPRVLNIECLPPCLFELQESPRKSASPSLDKYAEGVANRQASFKCNKRASPRSKSYRDVEKIRAALTVLKEEFSAHSGSGSQTSRIILTNWQLLMDAVQVFDTDVVLDSMSILTSSARNNLLEPGTVLHMLQHGLIFALSNTLTKTDEGPLPTVKLLHAIARSTPSAIPYMIDLVHRAKMFESFADFINNGFSGEAQMIVEFYYFITQTAMDQIFKRRAFEEPLIPSILLHTGITMETVESYGPVATMVKCLSPSLISNSINKCLSRANLNNGDFIKTTFLMLANTLQLIQVLSASENVLPQHEQWIADILCSFRDSGIENSLASMIKGLERKLQSAESSEHCSQGVGVDNSAFATLTQCRHFISFYQQYYGALSSNFAELMKKVEPASPTRGADPMSFM